MLRRLGGCAVALALLLPAQAVAAPDAPAPDQRAAAATKARVVMLGHQPVRATTAHKVRLTFEGRKGQLVNLARIDAADQCGGRVLRRAGKTVKPWAPGYWRLPRTGTYTAINKPCRREEKRIRLQVRRVVQHDAAVPGLATTIGKRAHVTHLVPVRIGADQRVGLESSSPAVAVVGPDRRTTVADSTTELTARGRHWVVLGPESSLTTTLTVRRAAQVDGATISLPRMGTASTTQEVAFSGAADQWVYAELLDASGAVAADTPRRFRVFGPDGREVEKIVGHCQALSPTRCAQSGPWLLPSTGAYTMTVSALDAVAEQPATLRLRAAVVAPDLAVDGPAVTYTATTPGQWVIGRYPATPMQWEPTDSPYVQNPLGTQVWVEASNASASLGAWTYTMAPRFHWSLNCGPFDGQGCSEYDARQIGPGSPPVQTLPDSVPDAADSWALLTVPPGAQGSVDITLTRSATQP